MPAPREVCLEVRRSDGGWVAAGSVCEIEPLGSISDEGPDGRQVIVFGFVDGRAVVWRSIAGVDVATRAVRGIWSDGFEPLADLEAGPFEWDRVDGTVTHRIRFRLADC